MNLRLDGRLVQVAARAATAGGRHAASRQGNVKQSAKGDGTSVTEADEEVEDKVRRILTQETDYPVWGEETDERPDGDSYWVVDPIDGTRNYADGLPLYATSICLVKDSELDVAAVSVPALDDLWYAKRGKGAYRNNDAISVSEETSPEGYTSCASGYRALEAHDICVDVNVWAQRFHSAVYSLLTVADGANEFAVLSALYPWDIGGGALLIEEAGGRVEALGTADSSWEAIQNGTVLAWNGQSPVRDAVYEHLTDERITTLSTMPDLNDS